MRTLSRLMLFSFFTLCVSFVVSSQEVTQETVDRKFQLDIEQCDVSLNYGLAVQANVIELYQAKGKPASVTITDHTQLMVDGQSVALDPQQQALLRDYSQSIHQVTPKILTLINEVMRVVQQTFQGVAVAITEDERGYPPLNAFFEQLQHRLDQQFQQSSKGYFIAQQNFSEQSAEIGDEFEQIAEQMVQDFIGQLLIQTGKLMLDGEQDLESKMNALAARMEAMGEQLEQELATQATALAAQSTEVCADLQQLAVQEVKLQRAIPELNQLNLIDVRLHATKVY